MYIYMLYVGITWIDYLLKLEMIEKQKMKGTETDIETRVGGTEIIRSSGNKLRFFIISFNGIKDRLRAINFDFDCYFKNWTS